MVRSLSCFSVQVLLSFLFFSNNSLLRAEFLLDQSFEPAAFDATYSLFNEQDNAQMFTVGVTGELGIVEVFVSNFDLEPLLFDVRRTVNGLPQAADSPLLVERAGVPTSITGEWFRFDFSADPIDVTFGDLLAIVLRSPTGSAGWNAAVFGGYDGGKGVGRDPTESSVWAGPGRSDLGDLGFRTYVRPVPEPASYLLLAAGAIGLLLGIRRCS